MDTNIEAFMVHVDFLSLKSRMIIYLAKKAQIILLLVKKVIIPTKYLYFVDIFSKNLAKMLPEQIRVNEYAIKLKKGNQPLYEPIYSLGPIKLEAFKIYLETNLANSFIKASKSPVGTLILFIYKPNSNFWLYVNYWGLNNLTIKNQYPLFLIIKFLNQLNWAKQFIQLDFTSIYH